jgi:hypothetical protein
MSMTHMEAARDRQEYDECDHGVARGHACTDCMTRAHADEVRALESEIDRLDKICESAVCMLAEGPDAIGGPEARQRAIAILHTRNT